MHVFAVASFIAACCTAAAALRTPGRSGSHPCCGRGHGPTGHLLGPLCCTNVYVAPLCFVSVRLSPGGGGGPWRQAPAAPAHARRCHLRRRSLHSDSDSNYHATHHDHCSSHDHSSGHDYSSHGHSSGHGHDSGCTTHRCLGSAGFGVLALWCYLEHAFWCFGVLSFVLAAMKSKYKHVTWHARKQRWVAQRAGSYEYFRTEQEATRAVQAATKSRSFAKYSHHHHHHTKHAWSLAVGAGEVERRVSLELLE